MLEVPYSPLNQALSSLPEGEYFNTLNWLNQADKLHTELGATLDSFSKINNQLKAEQAYLLAEKIRNHGSLFVTDKETLIKEGVFNQTEVDIILENGLIKWAGGKERDFQNDEEWNSAVYLASCSILEKPLLNKLTELRLNHSLIPEESFLTIGEIEPEDLKTRESEYKQSLRSGDLQSIRKPADQPVEVPVASPSAISEEEFLVLAKELGLDITGSNEADTDVPSKTEDLETALKLPEWLDLKEEEAVVKAEKTNALPEAVHLETDSDTIIRGRFRFGSTGPYTKGLLLALGLFAGSFLTGINKIPQSDIFASLNQLGAKLSNGIENGNVIKVTTTTLVEPDLYHQKMVGRGDVSSFDGFISGLIAQGLGVKDFDPKDPEDAKSHKQIMQEDPEFIAFLRYSLGHFVIKETEKSYYIDGASSDSPLFVVGNPDLMRHFIDDLAAGLPLDQRVPIEWVVPADMESYYQDLKEYFEKDKEQKEEYLRKHFEREHMRQQGLSWS